MASGPESGAAKQQSAWSRFLAENAATGKMTAGHCERNQEPIAEKVKPFVDGLEGSPVRVLEIACGTGQHAAFMAEAMKDKVFWVPTDYDSRCLASTFAWVKDMPNVAEPAILDASEPDATAGHYETGSFGAVYCCNCIHIAPVSVLKGIVTIAGRLVKPGGLAFIYGPFRVNGQMVESNERFDKSLRSQDPEWG